MATPKNRNLTSLEREEVLSYMALNARATNVQGYQNRRHLCVSRTGTPGKRGCYLNGQNDDMSRLKQLKFEFFT